LLSYDLLLDLRLPLDLVLLVFDVDRREFSDADESESDSLEDDELLALIIDQNCK